MANATELDPSSSAPDGFPEYFSAQPPEFTLHSSFDLHPGFDPSGVPELRNRAKGILGETAVATRLGEIPDPDNFLWLVETTVTEGASNGVRRNLLDAGYGVTPEGKFVAWFSDGARDWATKEAGRANYGRGLEALRRAGVRFSVIQAKESKTVYFIIATDAQTEESDTTLFDFDSIEAI